MAWWLDVMRSRIHRGNARCASPGVERAARCRWGSCPPQLLTGTGFVSQSCVLRRLYLLTCATTLLGGCPGSIDDPARFLSASSSACPSDFDVERDLFEQSCGTLGCHTGGTSLAAAGLDLTTDGIADRLKTHVSSECDGRALIVAGDPSGGFLLEKVGDSPSCGLTMPLGLPPLNATERACLEAYVAELAGVPAPADAGRMNEPRDEVDAGVVDPGADPPTPVIYQAESMDLTGYVVDVNNSNYIRIADGLAVGTARRAFDGAPGKYQLTVRVATEVDGQPILRVRLGEDLIATETYPLDTGGAGDFPIHAFGPYAVTLERGTEIVLEGEKNGDAWARVDELELTP